MLSLVRDPASGGVVDIIMPRTSSAPHQVEDESKQPLMPAQDNKVKDNVIESQAMSEEETASAGHSNAERNKSHLSEEHGDKKVSEGHRKHRRYLTAGAQCCSQTFTILQNLLAVPMTEALGTLTLTLVVGLLSRPAAGVDSLTAAIGVAAVLLAMINTGAPISGAHYNPAVTFALLLIGRVSPFRALVYIASQTVGAIGGAYLARGLAASDQLADPFLPEGVTGELALVEISFTYALVMVVIHTAFARAQQPNAYAGVAICATLVTGASLGAVMNPAVSAGLYVAARHKDEGEGGGQGEGEAGLWVRWMLPMAGGLIAACAFYVVNAAEASCPYGRASAGPHRRRPSQGERAQREGGREDREALLPEATSFPPYPATSPPAYARTLLRVSCRARAYVTEFQGAFLLTLVLALSSSSSTPPSPLTSAVSSGLLLAGLVFAGAYVSGGHFNPAVTLGVFLFRPRRKKIPRALAYVTVQLLAALFAGGLARSALGRGRCKKALPHRGVSHGYPGAWGAEAVFTTLLVLTILSQRSPGTQQQAHFGLAVGAVLTGGLLASASISGGGLNPAVVTGLYAWSADKEQGRGLWVYWLGPMCGSIVAVLSAWALGTSGRSVREEKEGRREGATEKKGGDMEEEKEDNEGEGGKVEGGEASMEEGWEGSVEDREGKTKQLGESQ